MENLVFSINFVFLGAHVCCSWLMLLLAVLLLLLYVANGIEIVCNATTLLQYENSGTWIAKMMRSRHLLCLHLKHGEEIKIKEYNLKQLDIRKNK